MIILVSGVDSLDDYFHRKEYLDSELRPSCCPNCSNVDSFWRHGKYRRKVQLLDSEVMIDIRRFKCRVCSKVASCLFPFLVPYLHFAANVIAQAVEGFIAQENSYLEYAAEVSDLKHSALKPVASCIFKWVDQFSRAAKHVLFQLQKEFVLRGTIEMLALPTCAEPLSFSAARSPEKRARLQEIVKLRHMAAFTFDNKADLFLRLQSFFLGDVEYRKEIFSKRSLILSTPHNWKST